MNRVVITGFSMETSFGNTMSTWNNLILGNTSIKECDILENFYTKFASFINDNEFQEGNKSKFDLNTALAVKSATETIIHSECSELDNSNTGVVIGSLNLSNYTNKKIFSYYGEKEHKRIKPQLAINSTPNSISAQIAIKHKLKGPNITISTACSSGANAISIGYDNLILGKATRMIVGGVDFSTPLDILKSYDNLKVMSKKIASPFSKNRDGFNFGEGVGTIMLETLESAVSREATIYAEIIGSGVTCDAYSMAIPDASGEMISKTMLTAIKSANISPDSIDYINAHATGTKVGDLAETLAIKKTFGSKAYSIPISSIKGAIGHTIGAAGAIEAIVSVLAIKHNIIPPTINFTEKDDECDLNYCINQPVNKEIQTVITNSFGFGGNNVSLILKEYCR